MDNSRFWDDLVFYAADDHGGIVTVGTLLAEIGALKVSDDEAVERIQAWLAKNEPSDALIASIMGSRFGKRALSGGFALSA
jgi:hypothetical protein